MSSAALPIDAVRSAFDDALASRGRVVVAAPTGSGKSTRLPFWCEEATDGTVLVVEPRRVACRSLASYLASQRGEQVGQSVGSWVRFDRKVGAETRLVFATPGIALRLLTSGDDWPFSTVVLDEFHERGWETDLLCALLAVREEPLVLTSATLDADAVAARLDAAVVRSEGRTFPLTFSYVDAPVEPSTRDLDERVAAAICAHRPQDGTGDVLVFLPGKGEIRAVRDRLGRTAFPIHEVHGGVPPGELAAVLSGPSGGRVFLATNVAETSLTVPGVTVVIDSGLVRRRMHRGGRSVLALDVCSKASMDQRAGRAGRVQEGHVVRLWSQRYRAAEALPPEIGRIPLDDVVLNVAAAGHPAMHADALRWVEPPPAFAWDDATERLGALGALDDEGHITSRGRAWAALPAGADEARLLANAPEELRAPLADLVALLEQRRRLLLPVGSLDAARADAVRRARRAAFGGIDDQVRAELAALRSDDSDALYLDRAVLRDARRTADQLRRAVGASSGRCDVPDRSSLLTHIVRRWPDSAYVARTRALSRRSSGERVEREPWANGSDEIMLTHWRPDWLEASWKPPVAGAVLNVAWLGAGGTGVRGVGGYLVPASTSELLAMGAGTATASRVRWRSRKRTRVVVDVDVELGGVVLGEREQEPRGHELREALAWLFLEDRWFRGGHDALLDALHLWHAVADGALRIVSRDPDAPTCEPPPEPQAWLVEQLQTLGLRTNDDIPLVELDDLLPDVPSLTGAPSWDLERLADEFPRVWEHLGAAYACRYTFGTGRVIMTPHNKAASKPPNGKLVPAFRGFRVFYEKASRRVPVR